MFFVCFCVVVFCFLFLFLFVCLVGWLVGFCFVSLLIFCFDNCCFGGFGFVCCCRWWMVGWLLFSIECFITCGFKVKGQNARVVTFEDPAKEQSFYLRVVLKTKGTTALGHRRAGFLLIIRFTRLANGCSLLLSSVSLFWKTVGEVSSS